MSNLKFNNKIKPFKEALDAKVNAYFKEKNISERGNWKLFSKSVILLPMAWITYLALLIFQPATVIAILLCILLGCIMACIGFNVMHDAAHGSYSENKNVNNMMALSLNMMGGSDFMWKIKHNIVHHTYTNIAGEDEDIGKHPLFRFSPEQKRFWYHRYQHIYASFLYLFTSLIWVFLNDYQKYFSKKVEATPIRTMKRNDKVIFWISKLLYLVIFLVVPALVFGFWPAFIGFFIMHAALGLLLSFVFQMAHCVEDTRFPAPDPLSNKIENEWAIHQVATTANFATKSYVISWLVGGLNFQIEHHLFPRISHVHYRALSPIVKETCKEFNIPYVSYPTFGQAIISHIKHLRNMGKSTAGAVYVGA